MDLLAAFSLCVLTQPVHYSAESEDCCCVVEIILLCKLCKFLRGVLRSVVTNSLQWNSVSSKHRFQAVITPCEVTDERVTTSG